MTFLPAILLSILHRSQTSHTSSEAIRAAMSPILQKALNDHGERLTVDGIFGRQTEKAVKDFQAQSGLESTGEVDSGTWSALSNPAPEA